MLETKMKTLPAYHLAVTELILQQKELNIYEPGNIERIKTLFFDETKYYRVVSLITEKKWDELQFLSIHTIKRKEYLDIVRFTDQNNHVFAATIYDSYSNWVGLKLIDIFPLTLSSSAIYQVCHVSKVRL
jgi:hypothetical protein